MTDTKIKLDDVIRADVPRDPFWWTDGDHRKVFANYCERRGESHDLETLASGYCESLPIDEYGRGNVYELLTRDDSDEWDPDWNLADEDRSLADLMFEAKRNLERDRREKSA